MAIGGRQTQNPWWACRARSAIRCVAYGMIVGGYLLGARAVAQSADPGPMSAAQWIADASAVGNNPTDPFPLLRKSFTLASSPITHATLLATALGSYQATINGESVSQAVLTPDWTDYRRRVRYQTYDVTKLLRPGVNAIGVMLGEGWYGSPMAGMPAYGYSPPPVRFIGVLHVVHADGTTETVASDTSWRSLEGPVLMAQIYAGETYDARRLPSGWNRPGFDEQAWAPVAVLRSPKGLVFTPQNSPMIERTMTLVPVHQRAVGSDTTVYDLGQNMVGWVRIHVRGAAGDTVRLRHAEILMPDSVHVQTANLTGANATDRYTLAGGGEEALEPHFTYHGFRYIEVVTSPGVRIDSIVGVVIHTAATETATFESSNPAVNRLWQNVLWTVRGNLMSVPTDCPQRGERMGWLGDAAVIWPTATFLMDLRTFTRKWTQDLRDSQDNNPEGCYPQVSPARIGCGGPAWSDAGVLVPYAAYHQYGDTAMVRAHWASMERYMAFIADSNPNFRWEHLAGTFGDWAPPPHGEPTGGTLIATAYWAADALAMRDMARGLGDTQAAERYAHLYEQIRAAFPGKYISPEGVVGEEEPRQHKWWASQTSDVLALRYGLVPDSLRAKVTAHLLADIADHHVRLTTGFVGAARILPVLSEEGHDDVAYALLLTDSAPSWVNMISLGATTIWEFWDAAHNTDRGVTTFYPSSFNHYAYGAVGEWMIRYAAGITQDSGSAGFEHLVIHPHPDPQARLTHLAVHYDTDHGAIASEWTIAPATGIVTLRVTVPTHTTARVDVPIRDGSGYRYVSYTVSGGTRQFKGDPKEKNS